MLGFIVMGQEFLKPLWVMGERFNVVIDSISYFKKTALYLY